MLVVIFGLAGSGKNYVGNIFANNFRFHFWDADEALTPIMRERIKNKTCFTQEMRNDFCGVIIDKTKKLLSQYSNVVVSQALYKEINRKQISTAFPDTVFIHTLASNQLIFERLIQRGDQISPDYAMKISANFDVPEIKHLTIINNSDELSVIQQIEANSIFLPLKILPDVVTSAQSTFSSRNCKSLFKII